MRRRGAAMVIVLAASVVLLTAATIVARVQATSVLMTHSSESFSLALELSEASESAVLEWLRTESRDVVLDPGSSTPTVSVLSDALQIGDRRVNVEITGWDQCGMIPHTDLSSLPGLSSYSESVVGNDGVARSLLPGLDSLPDRQSPFPSRAGPDKIGALAATHNPHTSESRRRGGAVPAVNINTAPAPLLRACFQDLSLDGLDQILADRSRGERAVFEGKMAEGASTLRFVSSSSSWSFRTDVNISGPGHAAVSAWSVYCLRGGTWVLEQRYVITE